MSNTGLSDRKLFEHLNGSIHHQLFCGIFLGPEKLADFKIISRIRTEIARKLNIQVTQDIRAKAWKPYCRTPTLYLRMPPANQLAQEKLSGEEFWEMEIA